MIYIGIDPGKNGAMAVIGPELTRIRVHPFDEKNYDKILWFTGMTTIRENCFCCLERVGAMPKQGVTSTFSFGENYGFIKGLLTAYSIPFELVTPQKWKKEFGVTRDKNTSISVCKRLFPDVDLRKTDRCRKDHDGKAEALLLAEYARRKFGRPE